MYAIVEVGAKQYRIEEGDILEVEKLPYEEGKEVVFDKVLAFSDGDNFIVGNPYIKDIEVKAVLEEHKKGKKVIIFKYKRRHKYRVKKGHRQQLSKMRVSSIRSNKG